MTQDQELLRRYAEAGSEDAFAELVRRHLDLVYSAALRQVNGDAHLAQDVAQSVFTDLARKAGPVSRHTVLTGWLYTSTHYAAAKAVRAEQRRHTRENEAHAMHEILDNNAPVAEWEELRPAVDALMNKLSPADREVILLRYFENRPLAAVGESLGVSEDAARKRVDRALERLRGIMSRRGLAGNTALAGLLAGHAVHAAPVGLAGTLTAASLAGAGAGVGSTMAMLKAITMTKTQIGILSALLVGGMLVPAVLQNNALAGLRAENASLAQQVAQLTPLTTEQRRLSDLLAAASAMPSLPPDQFTELVRLRGETGREKDELAKLDAQIAVRQNSISHRALREPSSRGYFPKEAWATAGFGTPEAAMQSYDYLFGQVTNFSSLKALLGSLPPAVQADAATHFAGKSEEEISADLAAENEHFHKINGIRVVNKQMISDDETVVTCYTDGPDGFAAFRLKKDGAQWHMAAGPNRP